MMMRGSSRSSSRCQDCGNQAKRDCAYMRCRTCCKGKGFECQTHIKSTWLPSSSSSSSGRPQKQTLSLLHHHHLPSSVHQQNPSWLSEIPFSAGLEEEEKTARTFPATLRRIKVSSLDDSITQYAYQTTVSIGGHVFKGILYDQGVDSPTPDHFSAMAEPHQPNLSNAHYHSCPNFPSGMQFFQSPSSP